MKKSLLYAGLSLSLLACNKYNDIESPADFQVSTDKLEYKVGDSVLFNFNSGPNQIIFYSGENGKRYENRSRSMLAGTPKLVFQASMQQGVLSNLDSLQLMISENLQSYDSAGIANAAWKNISARNTKWPVALSTSYTTSDSIDLSDFNNASKVNIAFRVKNGKYANAAQRKWNVQGVTLTNFLPDGTSSVLFNTFAGAGWVQASLKNNSTPGFMAWNVGTAGFSASNAVTNTSGITIRNAYPVTFDPGTAVNVDANDDWLVAAAVDLKAVRPDLGTTIKNDINGAITGFSYLYQPGVYGRYLYIFRTPGVYNVTFVGSNFNNNRKEEVVRSVRLTINP